ncbi:MAG TPA: SgcJ/EcaC family oxidoreductase [Pyrinomonadaceae bacterium]
MSQRMNMFACLALALLLAGAQSGYAQTPKLSGADETAIRRVVQGVQDAWNAHDGKAFAAQFAADADYVVVNGMYIKGREEIERGHVQIFTTIYKDSRNVATVKSIRLLRPDVAVAHVEWNLEFKVNDQPMKARGMNTMIMTREGGKWSIAAFQNTPVQPDGRQAGRG